MRLLHLPNEGRSCNERPDAGQQCPGQNSKPLVKMRSVGIDTLRRMVRLLPLEFVTTISGLPSPLRSATAMDVGRLRPPVNVSTPSKPPLPTVRARSTA